jgi:hypothetical protein
VATISVNLFENYRNTVLTYFKRLRIGGAGTLGNFAWMMVIEMVRMISSLNSTEDLVAYRIATICYFYFFLSIEKFPGSYRTLSHLTLQYRYFATV